MAILNFWFSEKHSKLNRAHLTHVCTIEIDGQRVEYTQAALANRWAPANKPPVAGDRFDDYKFLGRADEKLIETPSTVEWDEKLKSGNEEILFKYPDPVVTTQNGFGYVTLITHSKGGMSLHLQTGEHHERCVVLATEMLKWRGLRVGNPVLLGPSGMYYKVEAM